jgi:hypothetical protein
MRKMLSDSHLVIYGGIGWDSLDHDGEIVSGNKAFIYATIFNFLVSTHKK